MSVTKVSLVMRIISVIGAAIRKKKKAQVVGNGATWHTFFKSQGKFFWSFLCNLFLHIFDT